MNSDTKTKSIPFLREFLLKLGLEKEEALVLSHLIDKGQMTILSLSRSAGIERTKLYSLSEKMLHEGLLEEVTDYNHKYLRTCSLGNIELLVHKRREEINYLESSLSVFKQIAENSQQKNNPTHIAFYRGRAGIRQMLWNELDSKDKELFSVTYRHLGEVIGARFADKLAVEYRKRKIKIRDIQMSGFSKSITKAFHTPVFDVDARYISPAILDAEVAIDVYDDTVCIFSWRKKEVFGVEVVNPEFAEFMKQIYKLLWKVSGKEGVL